MAAKVRANPHTVDTNVDWGDKVLERGEVQHVGPSDVLSRDIELRKKVLWL